MHNNSSYLSPWIYELKRDRNALPLTDHTTTDCVVIGGGISGVLTVEALLSSTDNNVVLIDAGKIAHGATGHNAGQLTTYVEKPLKNILAEYGKEASYNTLHAVEHAGEKLLALKEVYNLSVPLYFFEGYTGIQSREQMNYFIEQQQARSEIGLTLWNIYVTREFLVDCNIPLEQYSFFSITDTTTIQRLLITDSLDYHAAVAEQKGCANSAQLTEELASALLERFPERFTIYENSPVTKISLDESVIIAINTSLTITSRYCILCTNGFENFTISSNKSDIDSFFHTSVEGLVGYMGAYTDTPVDSPTAISYLTNRTDPEDYYYLTRRPFAMHNNTTHNLISVGGPDNTLNEIIEYDAFSQVDESTKNTIEHMLKKNYMPAKDSDFKFSFLWHGLMGYTKTHLRMVGPDPRDPRLLYNIGCNGVGILPATISAPRIADIISGKQVSPSLFDINNK